MSTSSSHARIPWIDATVAGDRSADEISEMAKSTPSAICGAGSTRGAQASYCSTNSPRCCFGRQPVALEPRAADVAVPHHNDQETAQREHATFSVSSPPEATDMSRRAREMSSCPAVTMCSRQRRPGEPVGRPTDLAARPPAALLVACTRSPAVRRPANSSGGCLAASASGTTAHVRSRT